MWPFSSVIQRLAGRLNWKTTKSRLAVCMCTFPDFCYSLISPLFLSSALDLLEVGEMRCQTEEQLMRCQIREQFMAMRAETRPIFGEECGCLQLPAVIACLADLLPANPSFAAPPQAPIFNAEVTNTSEAETYFTLRERLIFTVHELYNSLLLESGMKSPNSFSSSFSVAWRDCHLKTSSAIFQLQVLFSLGDDREVKWTELNLRNESSFWCVLSLSPLFFHDFFFNQDVDYFYSVVLVALINEKTPLPLLLLK